MTHTNPLPDSAGDFGEYQRYEGKCRKCNSEYVRYRMWESRCGGYEDYQFRCFDCGHSWWVDGIDS